MNDPIYVPLALRCDRVQALQAAACAVIESFKEDKRPQEEYQSLVEALNDLDNALDKKLMENALQNGESVGEIMLSRIQRQLERE